MLLRQDSRESGIPTIGGVSNLASLKRRQVRLKNRTCPFLVSFSQALILNLCYVL